MIRLNIVAEGSTEENFINEVLRPYFLPMGIHVFTRRIRTGWNPIDKKPAKGGLMKYSQFRNDLMKWIESDRRSSDCWYSSMIDLYAFPKDNRSPYQAPIRRIIDPYQKVEALERAIAEDISHPRFIPYVQLHEFEAFLLVDPHELKTLYPERELEIQRLAQEIGAISPEKINERPEHAPSKRIIRHIPEYAKQKNQVGPMIAEELGIFRLREQCPHFDAWVNKLENTLARQ